MFRSLAAIFAILGFTGFALVSTYAAMIMYWWFQIFRPHDWMWWDLSMLRLPLVATALFLIPALLKGYHPFWRNITCYLMLAFLGIAVISTNLEGCSHLIQSAVNYRTPKTAAVMIMAALISARLCRTPTQVLGWILIVALSLVMQNGKSGIASLVFGWTLYDANVGSGSFTGTNAASMGGVMAMMMIVFLLQILFYKHEEYFPRIRFQGITLNGLKMLLLALMVGVVGFIVATQSRGAFLALVLAFGVWGLLHKKRLRVVAAGMIALAGFISVVGVSQEYQDRVASVFAYEEERDESVASRPHFWGAAMAMANDHPFGVGMGCFRYYYENYDSSQGEYGEERSVHSSHFAVLSELGYPGIFVWAMLFLTAFVQLFQIRRNWSSYLKREKHGYFFYYFANSMIALKVGFLFGGSFYEMVLNDITWMCFALVIAVKRISDIEFEIVKARERALAANVPV